MFSISKTRHLCLSFRPLGVPLGVHEPENEFYLFYFIFFVRGWRCLVRGGEWNSLVALNLSTGQFYCTKRCGETRENIGLKKWIKIICGNDTVTSNERASEITLVSGKMNTNEGDHVISELKWHYFYFALKNIFKGRLRWKPDLLHTNR